MRLHICLLTLSTGLLCLGYATEPQARFTPDTHTLEIEQDGERRAEIYSSRGFLLRRRGEYDRAIANLTKAIEIDPRHLFALANRGVAWRQKGRYDRAVADLTKALEIRPGRAALLLNRGLAYEGMAAYSTAAHDYSRAITVAPKNAAAFRHRGNIHRYLGRYDEAIADYNQSIRLDDKNLDVYFQRGKASLLSGQPGQAEADLQRIVSLNPKLEAMLRNSYCWELALAGRPETAFEHCERSLKAMPDRPNTLDSRAFILWQMGHVDTARSDLEKSGRARPSKRFGEFRVLLIQKALVLQGYGELKIDGRAGEKTAAAIRTFEEANGLPLTGKPSKVLFRSLELQGGRSD